MLKISYFDGSVQVVKPSVHFGGDDGPSQKDWQLLATSIAGNRKFSYVVS